MLNLADDPFQHCMDPRLDIGCIGILNLPEGKHDAGRCSMIRRDKSVVVKLVTLCLQGLKMRVDGLSILGRIGLNMRIDVSVLDVS